MSSEYQSVTIGDVCDVGDGAHSKVERVSKGIPYLTSKNIKQGTLDTSKVDYISEDDFARLFTVRPGTVRRPESGDVLMGIIGTFGNFYQYKESDRFGVSSAVAILRPRQEVVCPEYLGVVCSSTLFKSFHQQVKSGSVQGYTNISTIKTLPIPLPPLHEQKAIAHILGTLDDKIELNRKTNETLEAMAKALFKSWFVDFDPVRAKAEGRPTGLPAEISDLFPDSFEDSELGEIPRGWQVKRFEQVCKSIYSGGTPLTTEPNYWDGDLPWFSSGETRAPFVNRTEKTITSLGVKESSTRLASKFSTVIASAGQGHTRGQVSMLLLDSYVNQSVVVLEPSKEISSEFFVFFDASRRYDEFRRVSDSSSSRGSLTTKILASLLTVDPLQDIHNLFRRMVEADIRKVGSNLDQTGVLTQARDALLPKLISGELRIPDAEKMLEEAGI
jgi:type I restriction enzyme S subunit